MSELTPEEIMSRTDGWLNAFTLLGTGADTRKATKFTASTPLAETEIDALYTENGLARRIVEAYPKHATRRWLYLENDNDNRYTDELKRLKARAIFREAGDQARLHGGAIVVVYTDSGDIREPLDLKTASNVTVAGLEVFDRWSARPLTRYTEGANIGRPEVYSCYKWDGSCQEVHESRTIYVDGAKCTRLRRRLLDGFGDSVLVSVYEQMRSQGASYGYVEGLLSFYEVMTMTIDGLGAMIAGGQEDLLKKRIEILRRSRSMLNMIMLDKGEIFERKSSSLTGIPEVLDRMVNQVAMYSGIPVKILAGISPAGLQATGDADIRSFYDDVSCYQSDELEPGIDRLISIIMAGLPPESGKPPVVKWLPLWEPDEKDAATARKTQAETDDIYIERGVLGAMEVRKSRFVGGQNSTTTVEELEGGKDDTEDKTDDVTGDDMGTTKPWKSGTED